MISFAITTSFLRQVPPLLVEGAAFLVKKNRLSVLVTGAFIIGSLLR